MDVDQLFNRRRFQPHTKLADKLILLPHYGEFGWFILKQVRCSYMLDKEHIVCCLPGQECLFPNAKQFYYDWINPLKDSERVQCSGIRSTKKRCHQADMELIDRLAGLYSDYVPIRPIYPSSYSTVHVKFRPVVESYFPPCDIVVAPRCRQIGAERNASYWSRIIEGSGVIGIAGAEDSSLDLPGIKAWAHPGGATAGTVDLLSHCKIYYGGDSGVSHLAAMMDVPSVIFRTGLGNMVNLMKCNKNLIGIYDDYDIYLHGQRRDQSSSEKEDGRRRRRYAESVPS